MPYVAPLAQWLEQRPFKSWVQGSSPWGGTQRIVRINQCTSNSRSNFFGNAALITSSDMGWFLFLVDSRFLGGMIGVVDQGKGIHKNFRTRAVELS